MSARSEPESTRGRLSIGEVVSLLRPEFGDLTDSKIRFLEDRKLISPARTSGGYRSFGPHDVEVLRWILTRQRDQYLPLSIIGERIDRGEHLVDIWGIGAHDVGESPNPTAAGEPEPVAVHEPREEAATQTPADSDAAEHSHPAETQATSAGTQPPWTDPEDFGTYNATELSAESGLTLAEVAELTEFGLLVPLDEADAAGALPTDRESVQASLGLEPPEPRYGSGALLIARISREFSTYGLGARHLRVIRNSAARDATMFEQGIQPVLHAGGASAGLDAQRSLGRLVALCERLRSQVMGEALRRYWRNTGP